MHNVYDALACIATCYEYGIDKEDIKEGLLKYTGAHRRFEFVGSTNGANVFDDYGHHPTEIKAVYDAMKKKNLIGLGLYSNHTHIVEPKIFLQILLKFFLDLTI